MDSDRRLASGPLSSKLQALQEKKVVLLITSSAQLALTAAQQEAQQTGFYLELCDNVGSQSIELS